MNDTELLRHYLQDRSEAAFAELVGRYIDFVHSSARRQVGDDQMAEDVTQKVFCLLAAKAHGLVGQRTLGGWLYRATRFTAARAMRGEQRRRRREQEAGQMNENNAGTEEIWEELAPLLDDALEQLGESDRAAVLLRFFQKKSLREVGATLGVSEAAAKMRLARSLERLRGIFAKRGVVCSATGLAVLLAERSVSAAPARMAAKVTAKAFANSAGALSLGQIFYYLRNLGPVKLAVVLAGLGLMGVWLGGLRGRSFLGEQNGEATKEAVALVDTKPKYIPSIARPRAAREKSMALMPTSAELDVLIEKLRVALHDTRSTVVPGEAVVAAVKAFGPAGKIAFGVLKEETAAHDEQAHPTETSELAPRRAVSGMGWVGKDVPGVTDFLWDTFQTSGKSQDSIGYDALIALEQLGFEPKDMALLCQRVLTGDFTNDSEAFVKSQVAVWIAEIIRTNEVAAQPFLGEVEVLLNHEDEGVRFWAACALLEHEGATNPKVMEELENGLRSADKNRLSWASDQIFKTIGAGASR